MQRRADRERVQEAKEANGGQKTDEIEVEQVKEALGKLHEKNSLRQNPPTEAALQEAFAALAQGGSKADIGAMVDKLVPPLRMRDYFMQTCAPLPTPQPAPASTPTLCRLHSAPPVPMRAANCGFGEVTAQWACGGSYGEDLHPRVPVVWTGSAKKKSVPASEEGAREPGSQGRVSAMIFNKNIISFQLVSIVIECIMIINSDCNKL